MTTTVFIFFFKRIHNMIMDGNLYFLLASVLTQF